MAQIQPPTANLDLTHLTPSFLAQAIELAKELQADRLLGSEFVCPCGAGVQADKGPCDASWLFLSQARPSQSAAKPRTLAKASSPPLRKIIPGGYASTRVLAEPASMPAKAS
jgi:hypothetical protein